MPAISVNFDTLDFQRGLLLAHKKQFPFAIQMALNSTAFDVRRSLVSSASNIFALRTKFLTREFHIEKAEKEKLFATIGNYYEKLVDHVEGATRAGKGERAIPSKTIRPAFRSKVKKSSRPHELLTRGKRGTRPFFLRGPSGEAALVKRQDIGKTPVVTLYNFPKKVPVPKRFPFEEIVHKVVSRRWEKYFIESADKALRTAR